MQFFSILSQTFNATNRNFVLNMTSITRVCNEAITQSFTYKQHTLLCMSTLFLFICVIERTQRCICRLVNFFLLISTKELKQKVKKYSSLVTFNNNTQTRFFSFFIVTQLQNTQTHIYEFMTSQRKYTFCAKNDDCMKFFVDLQPMIIL